MLSGSDVQIVNNDFIADRLNDEPFGGPGQYFGVTVYFIRGEILISGNSLSIDVEAQDNRLRFVYLTASGNANGPYYDIWNSRGGDLMIKGNMVVAKTDRTAIESFVQDYFNQYEICGVPDQSPSCATKDLYSAETKLNLELSNNLGELVAIKSVFSFLGSITPYNP